MDNISTIALKAKIALANGYLDQILEIRKIDSYDIRKVVTPSMREFVEIATIEQAQTDGLGIVRFKEAI